MVFPRHRGHRDRGYSEEEITTVMGGNTLRVFQQVLPD